MRLNDNLKIAKMHIKKNQFINTEFTMWQIVEVESVEAIKNGFKFDRTILLAAACEFALTIVLCNEEDYCRLPGTFAKATVYKKDEATRTRDYKDHYTAIRLEANPEIFPGEKLYSAKGRDLVKGIIDDLFLAFYAMQEYYLEAVEISSTDGFMINTVMNSAEINGRFQVLDTTKFDDITDQMTEDPMMLYEMVHQLIPLNEFEILEPAE